MDNSVNKNRTSYRLWFYALVGLVLTVILSFPIFNVTERSRMKRELREMNQEFWDAVIEEDFTAASQHLAFVGDVGATDDELAQFAAEWTERAQALHDSGVSVVRIENVGDVSDDFCPKLNIDVVVEYGENSQSYLQRVGSSPKCGGAGFESLWITSWSHPSNSFEDESDKMQEIMLTLSSEVR